MLRFIDPPRSTLMMIRQVQGYPIQMRWQTFAQLPLSLRRAAIAGEDLNFCSERFGIDRDAFGYQFAVWRAGGHPKGASTIAMQTARNLFLWPDRSFIRKALELWLAPQIAVLWPRSRLLEIYLNIAEFGPGIYGAESGAQFWFGVPLGELSDWQIAVLVAILPAPLSESPTQLSARASARAAVINSILSVNDERLRCAE